MPAPFAIHERNYIIELSALGNTRKQIVEKFRKRYRRSISLMSISRLRNRKDVQRTIDEAQTYLTSPEKEFVHGSLLKQKAYKQLEQKLEQAEKDDSEIGRLRTELNTGTITRKEFDQKVARYERLTVNELVKIADMAHNHVRHDGEETPMTPEDKAAFGVLMEGLKTGNPLQIIQVLNPKVYPNGESPAPPADIPPAP